MGRGGLMSVRPGDGAAPVGRGRRRGVAQAGGGAGDAAAGVKAAWRRALTSLR